jgi:hypothetical protein
MADHGEAPARQAGLDLPAIQLRQKGAGGRSLASAPVWWGWPRRWADRAELTCGDGLHLHYRPVAGRGLHELLCVVSLGAGVSVLITMWCNAFFIVDPILKSRQIQPRSAHWICAPA